MVELRALPVELQDLILEFERSRIEQTQGHGKRKASYRTHRCISSPELLLNLALCPLPVPTEADAYVKAASVLRTSAGSREDFLEGRRARSGVSMPTYGTTPPDLTNNSMDWSPSSWKSKPAAQVCPLALPPNHPSHPVSRRSNMGTKSISEGQPSRFSYPACPLNEHR
jgi:hypothetical protein